MFDDINEKSEAHVAALRTGIYDCMSTGAIPGRIPASICRHESRWRGPRPVAASAPFMMTLRLGQPDCHLRLCVCTIRL